MNKNLIPMFFLALGGATLCPTESVPLRLLFIVSTIILGPIVVYQAFASKTLSKGQQKRNTVDPGD